VSGQTFLYVLFAALVVGFFVLRALFRAWVVSRVRRAAREAEPAVSELQAAIIAFRARFPVPAGERLPLDPEDYPAARPRKPSPPRPRTTSRRRRSGYRRRYR